MARAIDADKIEYYDDEQGFEMAYKVDIDALPTLTPPNEWVSVEERLPEDEARQYIEDDLDGIGYLYHCLLTYKSPNTERIHEGCKWKNRHQKCSCCRRNRHMKDSYEGNRK